MFNIYVHMLFILNFKLMYIMQCLVSLLRLGFKYCNAFLFCMCMMYLICDTIINYYLLTYLLTKIRQMGSVENRKLCRQIT